MILLQSVASEPILVGGAIVQTLSVSKLVGQ